MKQGMFGFQYEEEKKATGMTGLGGLGVYLEMAEAMGMRGSVERHVGVRRGGQGWRDSEVVMALVLMNLAGGESVGDLEVLEKDKGFCRILGQAERYGKGARERRLEGKRWRRGRVRGVPSASAVFRYLEGFHEAGEESRREEHKAFIPAAGEALKGLWKVNGDVMGLVQRHGGPGEATLDMDATLVESEKREALASYKKTKAYQPLTTYWAEAEMVVQFGVSGRQRTGGASAEAGDAGSDGTPAQGCHEGPAEVGHGGVSAGVVEVLRRGQRRTLRSD